MNSEPNPPGQFLFSQEIQEDQFPPDEVEQSTIEDRQDQLIVALNSRLHEADLLPEHLQVIGFTRQKDLLIFDQWHFTLYEVKQTGEIIRALHQEDGKWLEVNAHVEKP